MSASPSTLRLVDELKSSRSEPKGSSRVAQSHAEDRSETLNAYGNHKVRVGKRSNEMHDEKELKKGMADCLSLIDTPGRFVKGLQEFLLKAGTTDSARDLFLSRDKLLIIKDELVAHFSRTGKNPEIICTALLRNPLQETKLLAASLLPLIVYSPRPKDLGALEGFFIFMEGWELTNTVARRLADIIERDYLAWLTYLHSLTGNENPWIRRLVLLCLWRLAKKIPRATPELKKVLINHDQNGAMEVREEIAFVPRDKLQVI